MASSRDEFARHGGPSRLAQIDPDPLRRRDGQTAGLRDDLESARRDAAVQTLVDPRQVGQRQRREAGVQFNAPAPSGPLGDGTSCALGAGQLETVRGDDHAVATGHHLAAIRGQADSTFARRIGQRRMRQLGGDVDASARRHLKARNHGLDAVDSPRAGGILQQHHAVVHAGAAHAQQRAGALCGSTGSRRALGAAHDDVLDAGADDRNRRPHVQAGNGGAATHEIEQRIASSDRIRREHRPALVVFDANSVQGGAPQESARPHRIHGHDAVDRRTNRRERPFQRRFATDRRAAERHDCDHACGNGDRDAPDSPNGEAHHHLPPASPSGASGNGRPAHDQNACPMEKWTWKRRNEKPASSPNSTRGDSAARFCVTTQSMYSAGRLASDMSIRSASPSTDGS